MEPFGKISSGNQPQTVETELKQISQFQREAVPELWSGFHQTDPGTLEGF